MKTILKLILLLAWPALLLAQGGTPPGGYGPGSSSGGGITSVASTNSGLAGSNAIYPNAPPYNISFDGKVCNAVNASWPNTSTTVNCNSGSPIGLNGAVLTTNVVTITWTPGLPFNPLTAGWVNGQNVTVAGFTGADTFFNGTFALTGVTNTTITYALTHANGTSSTITGFVKNAVVGPFVPADGVGKVGFGTNCDTGVLACVAASAIRPLGTVTYVSATQVTVSGNSTSACNGPGCQFWWFTDDRAKWGPGTVAGTVQNALENAQGCVSIVAPAGVSPIPFGLFNASNPTCGQVTSGAFGNLLSSTDIGNSVWGQGMGATIFLLPPDSDFTKCLLPGVSGFVCLWGAISGGGNFTIHGGGNGLPAGGPHNNIAIWDPRQNASFFDNISLTQFGSGDTGTLFGAVFEFANKYEGIYVDQFGKNPCSLSGVNVILAYYSCGNSNGIPMTIGGSGTIAHTNNGYIQATNGTIGVDVGAGSSNVVWFSEQDQSYGAVNGGGTHIYVEPGSVAHVSQWSNLSGALRGFQLGNTAKLYLRDSTATGSVNAIGTNSVAMTTGNFYDQGGNVFTGGIEATLLPTCAESAGNGTCAITTGSSNEKGIVRITAGTTTSTNPSFTLTFSGTFSGAGVNSPACSFSLSQTGTGSWVTAAPASTGLPMVTASSNTAQTVGITTTVGLVSTSTYDVMYNCDPR